MFWYVFDRFDCFSHFSDVAEAAQVAKQMAEDGLGGVHIAYMTPAQFDSYCVDNDLKKAWDAA